MKPSKVTLTAELVIKPGNEEAVLAAAKKCAVATRRERGCEQYILTTMRDRPNVILFLEVFKSQADFEVHASAPHTKAFRESCKGLVEGEGSKLTFLEQVNVPEL